MSNKIGVLLENRFIDQEIIYYSNRFQEEGFEVEFLTRLWGQEKLTFEGLELQMEKEVSKSFEAITDADLKDYAAFIFPAGYVSDYLLYAQKPGELSPAVKFLKKIMQDKSIIKAFICHALWISGPIPETFAGRKVTCHNNIIGHVKNTGALYQNQDIVIDNDLVTARHGGLFAPFAKKIIELLKQEVSNLVYQDSIIFRDEIEKEDIGGGILMQDLGSGDNMSALHWNMEAGSIVDWHKHPHEQFGYVIKGGFEIYMEQEKYEIKAGDAYFVPSNVEHKFIALAETEAIDIFNPAREDIPGRDKNQDINKKTGGKKMKKEILVCASNLGVWGEELQAPWDALKQAGYEVTLATPQGKKPLPLAVSVDPDFVDPIIDEKVNPPEVCARIKELVAGNEWANPLTFKEANMDDYDAIALAGGLGAMLDMANNYNLHKLILDAYRSDKLIGAVCYAVAALAFLREPKNDYKSVIYGKQITAHPRAWDFYGPDVTITFDLYGATEENPGTDLATPGFLFPIEDIVRDAVGPDGACIARINATREDPEAHYDWPFVTGTSVESSIAYGEKLVEALESLD